MRKLLLLILLLAVGVGVLGFYQGWFSVSASRDPETGRRDVQLTIDEERMKSDAQKAKQKVSDAVNSAKTRSENK